MYVLLVKKKFQKKENLTKHFFSCWREQHPNHISKEAPHSENITTREINKNITKFFGAF